MTRQEVFDIVLQHTRFDRRRSTGVIRATRQCLYHGPEGMQCFVGALVQDEDYDERMELCGAVATNVPVLRALSKRGIDAYDPQMLAMLRALQHIHDVVDTELWESELKKLAEGSCLQWTPP